VLVYAVVLAFNVAAFVYNAILNTWDVPVLKLNVPSRRPTKKVVVAQLPLNAN
jgi:hypothetical protein